MKTAITTASDRLAEKAHCTHSHALGLLEKMRGAGLLTIERRGKVKRVRLTVKGTRLREELKEFIGCLNEKNIC